MRWLSLAASIIVVAVLATWRVSADTTDGHATVDIPPEIVANFLHDIIEADRTAYTVHVVERMQMMGVVTAAENWRERAALPLPAQLLLEASRAVGTKPAGIRYRLMSLWPINPRNGPANDFEARGLEALQTAPERPYTGIRDRPGGRYFEAIYADRAVSQSCIGCHNAHASSPRRDFKRDDVMGAIVISIPVGPYP